MWRARHELRADPTVGQAKTLERLVLESGTRGALREGMPKLTAKEKVYVEIYKASGCTSVGLVAANLPFSVDTVRRYVDALVTEGRVEVGWDGNQLEITADEQRAIRMGLGLVEIPR